MCNYMYVMCKRDQAMRATLVTILLWSMQRRRPPDVVTSSSNADYAAQITGCSYNTHFMTPTAGFLPVRWRLQRRYRLACRHANSRPDTLSEPLWQRVRPYEC